MTMRKTLFFFIIFLVGFSLHAQIVPTINSPRDLQSLQVKSQSTSSNSPIDNEELLIFKLDYDQQGNVMHRYQLLLWEAVTYSYTTTYTYNEQGRLLTETRLQEFLNLYNRDEDYLHFFGNNPLHEKIIYHYNDQDNVSKKEIYTYGDQEPNTDTQPDQYIDFSYENDQLIVEESKSSDEKFFNRNYLTEYAYDSAGNLVHKKMAYGKEKKLQRNFIFKYNTEGQLVEEQVIDFSIPHNNTHLKYEYNADGQRSSKYVFNEEEEEFELETSYKYDSKGNVISGDREVSFEYYENGLIKSERWTEPTSATQITLTTTYEYF